MYSKLPVSTCSLNRGARFATLWMFCCLTALFASGSVEAGGWATVHHHVHKTAKCGADREVLASHYRIGTKTASGEKFDPHGLTAASHDYPLGTTINAVNPLNGKSCKIRINDRGPFGLARQMGAKLDFSLGAARCLGMRSAQYVCVPQIEKITADWKPLNLVPELPKRGGSF